MSRVTTTTMADNLRLNGIHGNIDEDVIEDDYLTEHDVELYMKKHPEFAKQFVYTYLKKNLEFADEFFFK